MTSVARPSHETASDTYVYNTHRHQKKGDSCRWSPFLSLHILGVCSHLLLKRENILRLTSLSLSRSHWLNQCSVHERFCERCIYAYREWARCIDCVKNNNDDDVYEWEKIEDACTTWNGVLGELCETWMQDMLPYKFYAQMRYIAPLSDCMPCTSMYSFKVHWKNPIDSYARLVSFRSNDMEGRL